MISTPVRFGHHRFGRPIHYLPHYVKLSPLSCACWASRIDFAAASRDLGDYVITERWRDVEQALAAETHILPIWLAWGSARSEVSNSDRNSGIFFPVESYTNHH